MATISFKLSRRRDENLMSEVLLRLSVSRTQVYQAKSGLFVPANKWGKKNELNIPKIESEERNALIRLNNQLASLKNFILARCLMADTSVITKPWLERQTDEFHYPEKYASGQNLNKNDFFKTFEDFVSKRKLSDIRKRSFQVVLRILRRFELYQKHAVPSYSLNLDTVTADTLGEIEWYMANEFTLCEKYPDIFVAVPESRIIVERGRNTVSGMMIKLRTFFIWANKKELTENNPFKKYSIEKSAYGTPFYISIEERNRLYEADLSFRPGLAVQRDIFVFQCLVGCRVGDFGKLTRANVINGAIEYIARKTKDGHPVTVRVPLNAKAQEIIDRYADENRESLFPYISEQKYNDAIKEAFAIVGLTRMVTVYNSTTREEEKRPLNELASSHMARRTFIGNLYKQVKDPNLVSSLSGHKEGSTAFARYREIDDDIKSGLVDLLL